MIEQNEELRLRLIQELSRRGTQPSEDVIKHALDQAKTAEALENSRKMAETLKIGTVVIFN